MTTGDCWTLWLVMVEAFQAHDEISHGTQSGKNVSIMWFNKDI